MRHTSKYLILIGSMVALSAGHAWAASSSSTGSALDANGNIQFSIYDPNNTSATPGSVKLTPDGNVAPGALAGCPDNSMVVIKGGKLNCVPAPVPNAHPIYTIESDTYSFQQINGTLYAGLSPGIGNGDPVAQAVYSGCSITDDSDTSLGSKYQTNACVLNYCTGAFGKYPIMAQMVGWCAFGAPECGPQAALAVQCMYAQ